MGQFLELVFCWVLFSLSFVFLFFAIAIVSQNFCLGDMSVACFLVCFFNFPFIWVKIKLKYNFNTKIMVFLIQLLIWLYIYI